MFDFVRDRRPIEAFLVSGRGHYQAVIEPVLGAARSVWIATATLKELMVEDPRARPGRRRSHGRKGMSYRSILEVFAEQVRRGVEVRVLHAALPSRPFRAELARHPELREGGRFQMRQCPRVHLKAVVVDGARVYLGSANWTGAGLGAKGEQRRNFEIGVVSDDDLLLDEVQALYDAIWSGARCPSCRLRDRCPGPLDGQPAAKGLAKAGLAKAGLAKAGLAKAGLAKAGLAKAGLAKAGLAVAKSRVRARAARSGRGRR